MLHQVVVQVRVVRGEKNNEETDESPFSRDPRSVACFVSHLICRKKCRFRVR